MSQLTVLYEYFADSRWVLRREMCGDESVYYADRRSA